MSDVAKYKCAINVFKKCTARHILMRSIKAMAETSEPLNYRLALECLTTFDKRRTEISLT